MLVAIAITYDMIWQIDWLVTSYNADGIYMPHASRYTAVVFWQKKMANATKKTIKFCGVFMRLIWFLLWFFVLPHF